MLKNPFEVLRSVLIFHQRTPKAKNQYIALKMSSFFCVDCSQSINYLASGTDMARKKHLQFKDIKEPSIHLYGLGGWDEHTSNFSIITVCTCKAALEFSSLKLSLEMTFKGVELLGCICLTSCTNLAEIFVLQITATVCLSLSILKSSGDQHRSKPSRCRGSCVLGTGR